MSVSLCEWSNKLKPESFTKSWFVHECTENHTLGWLVENWDIPIGFPSNCELAVNRVRGSLTYLL